MTEQVIRGNDRSQAVCQQQEVTIISQVELLDCRAEIFKKFLLSAFSFFDVSVDEPEKIYHSFVLGMLIGLKYRYEVKSNRESGYGRYDVMLIPKNPQDLGVVFEFKKVIVRE